MVNFRSRGEREREREREEEQADKSFLKEIWR